MPTSSIESTSPWSIINLHCRNKKTDIVEAFNKTVDAMSILYVHVVNATHLQACDWSPGPDRTRRAPWLVCPPLKEILKNGCETSQGMSLFILICPVGRLSNLLRINIPVSKAKLLPVLWIH
jgi:hypothetical protein